MAFSGKRQLSLSRKRKANTTHQECPLKRRLVSSCPEKDHFEKTVATNPIIDQVHRKEEVQIASISTVSSDLLAQIKSNEHKRSPNTSDTSHTMLSNSHITRQSFFVSSNYKDCRQQTLEKSKVISNGQPKKQNHFLPHHRFPRNTSDMSLKSSNKCPSYKWIPGTRITVDAFNYGAINNCSVYCLTHFHSDHYMGLNKRFSHPIYCSKVTANLICQELKVDPSLVHPLPLDTTQSLVDNVHITLLDANHCPGSVMMLFTLPSGTSILHTGDFRVTKSMFDHTLLKTTPIDSLLLDTTYCSPQFTFPPQDEVISFVVHTTLEHLTRTPNTLIVCGTYTIGKEKIFTAIAQSLGCKVYVTRDKYKILSLLESEELSTHITCQYPLTTPLHVLPLNKMSLEELCNYLKCYSTHYSSLLAFKPTGWTYSNRKGPVNNIRPLVRGPVTIYGVPYSEHSSFSELKDFVRFIKPRHVISTVGGAKARQSSERQCQKWLMESENSHQPVQLTIDCFINK